MLLITSKLVNNIKEQNNIEIDLQLSCQNHQG